MAKKPAGSFAATAAKILRSGRISIGNSRFFGLPVFTFRRSLHGVRRKIRIDLSIVAAEFVCAQNYGVAHRNPCMCRETVLLVFSQADV